MRCQYCGSKAIHPAKQHKTFSTGKAVAGAVTFGYVGAVAGLIGKDIDGYQCTACGQFMDSPMEIGTEMMINNAVSDAEAGRSRAMFDYYKQQYINIQANIPVPKNTASMPVTFTESKEIPVTVSQSLIKHSYVNKIWQPDCPVFIKNIIIKQTDHGDVLILDADNISGRALRSAYFDVTVLDDTNDTINTCQCVYQNLSVAPNQSLPAEKEFDLKTDIAYAVQINCSKASFEDGSVYRYDENQKSFILENPFELTPQNFKRLKYVKKYIGNISSLTEDSKLFMPIKNEEYWQCICGHPVLGNQACTFCNANYDQIQELISQKNLKAVQEKEVKERAAKRAIESTALYKKADDKKKAAEQAEKDRIAAEEAAKKKAYDDAVENAEKLKQNLEEAILGEDIEKIKSAKSQLEDQKEYGDFDSTLNKADQKVKEIEQARKKKASKRNTVIGILLAVVIGIIVFYSMSIKPKNDYSSALECIKSGDITKAKDLLKSNNYQDGNLYYSVIDNIDHMKYTEAFAGLENITDSTNHTKLMEYCSEKIINNLKNGEISISSIGDMPEGIFNSHLEELYDIAMGLAKSEDTIKDAAILFEACGDYKDAVNLANYSNGFYLMKAGEFDKALGYFEKCIETGNTKTCIRAIVNEKLSGSLTLDVAVHYISKLADLTSDEQAIIEKCEDLKKYEGLYIAYSASRNNGNGREYQNYDWNDSSYQKELTFRYSNGIIAYINGDKLAGVYETEGRDPTRYFSEFHQFKYYSSGSELLLFGPDNKALWCTTYYGPDAHGGNPLTLYLEKAN